MNKILQLAAVGLLLAFLSAPLLVTARAQGTAFTYQGRLVNGGAPANGSFDLQFALFDAAASGSQVGSLLTNSATAVSNGLFTVTLDFGDQFPGAARWLEIGVRTNGVGSFTILTPRQALTPAPYAIYAANAGSAGSVAAGNISGTLAAGQLPAAVVTNGASGVSFTGVFSGNGGGLTNLTATTPPMVFVNGLSTAPTTSFSFLSTLATITLTRPGRILVVSNCALGSTAAGGASNLNIYIGYRASGGFGLTSVGSGLFGLTVAQNQRSSFGLSAITPILPAGTYDVGLAGSSSTPANWNNNEYSYTSAIAF